jgi:hypothetical protein
MTTLLTGTVEGVGGAVEEEVKGLIVEVEEDASSMTSSGEAAADVETMVSGAKKDVHGRHIFKSVWSIVVAVVCVCVCVRACARLVFRI